MTSNLFNPSISDTWLPMNASLSGVFNIWLCIRISSLLDAIVVAKGDASGVCAIWAYDEKQIGVESQSLTVIKGIVPWILDQ
jgi:hypothetical protein